MSATERRAEDNWDTHWERYDELLSLNPAPLMRWDLIARLLQRHAPHTPRLLDIGSGQGNFLMRARELDLAHAYAGFELSASGVQISRRKMPGVDFMQVDVFAPPAEARGFKGWATAAVCSEVIEHVDDPVEFLRAVRDYLADDALLVLTVPGGPMSKFDHHIGHRFHYTKSLAHDTLARAGYRVERAFLTGFPFFNLFRLAVILRGARIVQDAELSEETAGGSRLTRIGMAIFRFLFKFNLTASPFGWQVIAVARNTQP